MAKREETINENIHPININNNPDMLKRCPEVEAIYIFSDGGDQRRIYIFNNPREAIEQMNKIKQEEYPYCKWIISGFIPIKPGLSFLIDGPCQVVPQI